ncbi:GTP cyclohydrolase II [Coprinopsis cinerea AmutBmut pab1-1]|nr:GTP cyclohydrolase II [Coprinopsis cinerea AmutBmut pab1-1]
MNDSDETSESESEEEDDDDDEFPRRRHQGSSRRARSEEYHPVTGQFEDVIQPPSPAPQAAFGPSGPRPAGSLRNPLPKPPRDLYEMTPYKSLLSLPQTTALLTASYNTQASTATATVAPAGVTIVPPVPNQAAPAAATAPPPPPAKKKGLFKRLSTKRKTQQPPAPVPAAPAVPSGPVFVPIYVDKNANPTAQQSQASSSNTQSNPPTNPVRFDDSVDSSTAANQSRRQSRVSSNAPDPSTLPLRFTQLDSEYAGFMNHSPHRVVYGHQTYPTATHVHEAMKYIDQHPQLAERIRNCENVLDVYPISAEISGFQRPDWGNVFLDKMEEVLRLKFSQHPNLRELLMGTWPRELIYADPLDDFWGEGPEARGRNELGKVLMRVRDRMKAETMIPQ